MINLDVETTVPSTALRSLKYSKRLGEVLPDVAKVLASLIAAYLLGVVAYKRTLRKYAEA